MKKFKLSLIVISIILLFIVVGYFIIQKNQHKELSPIIQAVPLDASVIIETNDLTKLISYIKNDNYIWNETKNLSVFEKFNNHILFIDSISSINKKIFSEKNILISTHLQGKSDVNFLYLISLPKTANQKRFIKLAYDLFEGKGKISKRTYNNETIYDIEINSDSVANMSSCYFCISKGILIFSFSRLLTENAIRQIKSNNPISIDYGFKKVSKTAGKNVIANIYINTEQINTAFIPFLSQEFNKKTIGLKKFANWTALDLRLSQTTISLSGYTYSALNSNKYLSIFHKQTASKNNIAEILPNKTSKFISFSFKDSKSFKQNYIEYLTSYDLDYKYKKLNNDFHSKYSKNPEKIINNILNNQITIASVNYRVTGTEYSNYIILKINNRKKAEADLNSLVSAYCDTNKLVIEDYNTEFKVNKNLIYKVYKMPFDNILNYPFEELYNLPFHKYYVFLDEYIVFTDNYENLRKFINSYVLKLNLQNEPKYKVISKQIYTKSNILFYLDFNREANNIASILNSKYSSIFNNNLQIFNKFQSLIFQLNSNDDLFYTNLFINYNPKSQTSGYKVWETKLNNVLISKPLFFTNHNSFEKELFIQDASNIIYLINNKGEILWKKQLSEKIISKIHIIDYYANNKYQFLFNTNNHIYVIDRNGDFVENYPVKLPAKATNGISVFDYNDNKDYRIFVACYDKQIYLYQKDGQINKGWKATQTKDYVKTPIQYFSYENKDYIIFADNLNIYILNRKGEQRINPKTNYPKATNTKFFFQAKNGSTKAKFISTTPAGKIINIYLDGTIILNTVKNFSHSHYFEYYDIDNDGSKDYIFAENNQLVAYTQDNKKIFSHFFKQEISEAPMIFKFSESDTKIGIVSYKEDKIYLINNDGTIYSGFPKRGSTPFSIGILNSNSKFNIIVGYKDKFIYNYLLNN